TVFRTLARLLGPNKELEDLAQEVFLRLFRGLAQFRGEAKLSTWLYRITVNVARDELRRRVEWRRGISLDEPDGGWADRLPAATADPGEGMDREMFLGSLREGMEQLSLRDRAILTLYYQEERSYREISDILELPMGTVKTQIHRAKERLKRLMKERMGACRTAS
ncbi:MAG: sigma-70 family RNA polymerase sigma factor, partial [Acidobacteria bacterium]|nr:sigma-70 family RNA polymerase sigma factor [Acidobacteriota bacterium]